MPQTTDTHFYKRFEHQTNTLSNIEEQIRINTIATFTTKPVCGYFFFILERNVNFIFKTQ
jgi:hypothetical protein